jgi:glycosyltransferase involved in cell wall biosynthesis
MATTEAAVLRGQSAARACQHLARGGFVPDVIVAHPGWGETLFLREVLPRTKLLSYCELFYRAAGGDVGFIPETALDLDGRCRLLLSNAPLLLALEAMDAGIAPTEWQRRQHPAAYQPYIAVAHEGVDVAEIRPNPEARFTLPDGRELAVEDEVVTFVARNLEPHRGFVAFMRALPALLRARPGAQVIICGAEGVSYGRLPIKGNWRETMVAEVVPDPSRVHFTGSLPRAKYLALLQISALHLYLSVPFVLSWSVVEALAAGCLVLGSDTEPVREVIEDGRNGFLVESRDPRAIAEKAADLLAHRDGLAIVRRRARETAVGRFALADCLARQARLVRALA